MFLFFFMFRFKMLEKIIAKFSKKSDKLLCVKSFQSPVGTMIAAADEEFLYIICFEESKKLEAFFETVSSELSCEFLEKSNELLDRLEIEINEYFDGTIKKFTVPIKLLGSEFQKEVWAQLQELLYGSTRTYGDLAKAMGRAPSHARAIGAACGANMNYLVVPCHRLVASGSKGGFSSGVDRKEWLINHEKKFST